MATKIQYPSYPTGSFNYLRRCERADSNGVNDEPETAIVKLKIAIVGAGVGGLATSIALKRDGHDVTVYESTPVLSEIGAGIQVPSNSSRILHSWGLESAMRKNSIKPKSLLWRRWEDGRVIANTRLNPQFQDSFGSPYYVTHRAHLHEVLHAKAVQLGVIIKLACRITKYNPDEPLLVLANGEVVHADLIVAADGLKSMARQTLLGAADEGLQDHGVAAYRATVSIEDMRANDKTAWILQTQSLNLWVGHRSHVMTYSIAGGSMFNLVLTHPETSDPGTWDQKDNLSKMKNNFKGWDPALTALLDMVENAAKWPIQDIIVPDKWSSDSKKMLLVGDAAHAMVPFMALGAAMAVEDAAALAECLRLMKSKDMLGHAISVFESVRIPRVKSVHEASSLHDITLHLPDGPEQRARDAAMAKEVAGEHFIESPNQWSDPTIQGWVYTYNPAEHVRKVW